jgi:hypothetical protein
MFLIICSSIALLVYLRTLILCYRGEQETKNLKRLIKVCNEAKGEELQKAKEELRAFCEKHRIE